MTPIYQHTGPDTAYLVKDYPYSFKLRCQIRYWLEHNVKLGWRFVHQTSNPKRSTPDKPSWNKPKMSTYSGIAGCLYLNDEGHVKWDGVTEFTAPDKALAFAKSFPKADMTRLKYWAMQKARSSKMFAQGELFMTVNSKKIDISELEKQKYEAEAATWDELYRLLGAEAS